MPQDTTTPTDTDTAPGADHRAARKTSRIMKWVGNFVLGGAIILIVVVLGAATLARYGIIDKLAGFVPFYLSLNPARALALIGLLGLAFAIWRKTGQVWKLAVGALLSGALTVVIYTLLVIPGGKVPPIHDVTTNLDDPPQFTALDRPPTSTGPFSVEEWRAFHESAYSHLRPVVIDKTPTQVLADARALAEQRGWEIVAANPEAGTLEATAYAGYVRFMDDVVVKVTPVADGSTRVDMRSVSQVGVSDLGYNAARVSDFLAELRTVD